MTPTKNIRSITARDEHRGRGGGDHQRCIAHNPHKRSVWPPHLCVGRNCCCCCCCCCCCSRPANLELSPAARALACPGLESINSRISLTTFSMSSQCPARRLVRTSMPSSSAISSTTVGKPPMSYTFLSRCCLCEWVGWGPDVRGSGHSTQRRHSRLLMRRTAPLGCAADGA